MTTIKTIPQVLGKITSSFPATKFGRLNYRNLELFKTRALKCHKNSLNAKLCLSEKAKGKCLRTRLRRTIERNLPYCKLKIIFRSKCRLNTLFRFKDPLEKKIRSGIIYRYTCSNCRVTYYGKTFRHFYTRAVEHMGISNLTGKRLKNVKQSAIADHLLQCNCAINFNDFSILATDCNKFKLLLRESLLIKRDKPILNRTIKSLPSELFD